MSAPPFRKKGEINNILNSMTSKSLSSLCEKICLPVTGHCKCRARLMVCSDTIIIPVGHPVHVCAGPWWRRHYAGGLLQWPDGLQGQAEDQPFPLAQSAQDLLQTQQLLYQNQGIRGESEFTLFICIFELENLSTSSQPHIPSANIFSSIIPHLSGTMVFELCELTSIDYL